MRKLKCFPGDVLWIPLSKGKRCLGRMYKGSEIGVYFKFTIVLPSAKELNSGKPDIVGGVFTTDFKKNGWVICGNIPFLNEENQWAPPTFNRDILDESKVSIYHKGVYRPASEKDIKGLHPDLMYKPEQLVRAIEAALGAR